jgi:hypothetical protein
VLFADRCGEDAVRASELPHVDLDSQAGLRWLNLVLRPYRAIVDPCYNP